MPLEFSAKYFNRRDVARDLGRMYVFGDNLSRKGNKGQSVIRGVPNAIGVATKFYPSMNVSSFFSSDRDLFELIKVVSNDLAVVNEYLESKATVVWPYANIGVGNAKLPEKNPALYEFICRAVQYMGHKYGVVNPGKVTVPVWYRKYAFNKNGF